MSLRTVSACLLVCTVLLGFHIQAAAQQNYTSSSSGQWNGNVWSGMSGYPGSTAYVYDNVVISSGTTITLTFNVDINNLTINSGATLSMSSSATLTVHGSFSNSGSFNNGGGSVVFAGSSTQYIQGTTATEFGYLTVNNSQGVSLGRSISVDSKLTLTTGTITTGSDSILIGTGASSVGSVSSSNGWVVGKLVRWIPNSLTSNAFPVGSATTPYPVEVAYSNSSPYIPPSSGTLSVVYTQGTPGVSPLIPPLNDAGATISYASTDGYWTLEGFGLGGGAYQLSITATGFTAVGAYQDLRVLSRANAGASWGLTGTHLSGTGSNSIPTARRSGMTSFEQYTIGGPTSALPVELAGFSAHHVGDDIVLRWNTATEKNNSGFDIQRSYDGTAWQRIGFVEGHGTINTPQSYSFTDRPNTHFGSVVSYRLVQIDRDGTTSTSQVVDVALQPKTGITLGNHPNPFNPSTNISFTLQEPSRVTLVVTNSVGQEVARLFDNQNMEAGRHTASFIARDLPSGVYFCRLVTETGSTFTRLILAR